MKRGHDRKWDLNFFNSDQNPFSKSLMFLKTHRLINISVEGNTENSITGSFSLMGQGAELTSYSSSMCDADCGQSPFMFGLYFIQIQSELSAPAQCVTPSLLFQHK